MLNLINIINKQDLLVCFLNIHDMPKISVIIPAFNAENTLEETLNSLSTQTYRDFEVIVVDDCSSDRTSEIASKFSALFSIRVLVNLENSGVSKSLNRAIVNSDSMYIARLDSDDIAHAQRLEVQMKFLNESPRIDVCGSDMHLFHSIKAGAFSIHIQPKTDSAIKTRLLQQNSISHPSVLLRRSFFTDVGLYDATYDYAEDYELWCRGAQMGKVYANLEAKLTSYRVHSGQIGQIKREIQFERDMGVKRKYITSLLGSPQIAFLPEIFSPLSHFNSREIALWAFAESTSALLKMEHMVQDKIAYADIIKYSISRHLK